MEEMTSLLKKKWYGCYGDNLAAELLLTRNVFYVIQVFDYDGGVVPSHRHEQREKKEVVRFEN